MPVAAVIFDFDGVIADTERLHLQAFGEAFAARGWTLDEADYFDRYIGFDDRGLIVSYTADRGITLGEEEMGVLLRAKKKAFGRHLSSPDILFPGAKGAIERMADRFPIGIASGALHHEIAAILQAGGLFDRFAAIVGADDVTVSKPSPESYLAAAAHLKAAPCDCVAIEDSLTGLRAARDAGMRTIAVTTTAPGHALVLADRVVGSLSDVSPEFVLELGAAATL